MQLAMENFSNKGFDRTRMQDIASAAGLAKVTLYLCFKELISFWVPYQRDYQEQRIRPVIELLPLEYPDTWIKQIV
jgi:AcrR family transcriptional regulator